ncbi:hypothetical protein DCC81_18960 [Chitinophaga parva]|uniref:SGNH hydrolase-type esterase domain-containing protein n=1 Tax=Chitinophaga parva TaxID=2169414 RepID=A0A2T7BJ65_9BACT|nr:GDSL-type esterase/lipase family protein [Chitinophaga parva]PUZ26304.1 hypothetical protein DCC81_18960 [Chitinophaga parva]
MQITHPSARQARSWRAFSFRLIALLLPLAVLLLLEAGLRLFGYGHSHALFINDPQHPGYLVMNRYASEKFFTAADNATMGNYELFRAQKQPGTFRVFVLGESTTVGYPYMHNGSFHRWLQYRFMQTFPSRNIEVINVSLTAVNSYTVLAFGKEVLHYQPDAVLVYTGHNEYYGAQGVASTSKLGNQRWLVRVMLGLRDLRLTQLIQNSIASRQHIDTSQNLMQRMAAEQAIALHSSGYQAGVDQFSENMEALARVYSRGKVPLFISTLVSNEKDLPPFTGDSAKALFLQGRQWYATGDFTRAAAAFRQAKDLDQLRFRAPEAMNAVLRQLPQRYSGVHLVDAHAVFVEHSPHGVIGEETLLEHVHPNLYGYALLSDAFYRAMERARALPGMEGKAYSFEQLLVDMPLTNMDTLFGQYDVMLLKKGWPFLQPIPDSFKIDGSVEGKLAAQLVSKRVSWNDAMDALMEHYQQVHDARQIQRIAEAVMLEYNTDPVFYQYASQYAAAAGDTAKAGLYAKRAAALLSP